MSENSAPSSNDKIGPARRDFCLSKILPASRPTIVPIAHRGYNKYKALFDRQRRSAFVAEFCDEFRINGYEIMASLKDAGKEGKRRKNKGNWSGDHSTDLVIPIHASEITRVNYSWQRIIILVSWIDPTRNRIVIVHEIF